MPELTNPRAERVTSVRALSGRSARLRAGLFVVEGPQGVREAVRGAPEQIRDLYATEAAAARYPEILGEAGARSVRVHLASAEVLAAMSPDAQGLLAVLGIVEPSLTGVLTCGTPATRGR
jgi:TrmH family RNA methyltransferase